MARDTTIAWLMCDEEESNATLDLGHATSVFEAWKKEMRLVNLKTEVADDESEEEGAMRTPKRGEHKVKVTLTDAKGKKLNEFRHKCICESPY